MPLMASRMSELGTESAFEVLARANALQLAGRSLINLGIGQPDFPDPGAYRRSRAQGSGRRPCSGYTACEDRNPSRCSEGGGGRPTSIAATA